MQTSDSSNFFRAENDIFKEEARKAKAERIKNSGAPVSVSGKILDIRVRGSDVWMAESGHIVRKLSLKTGKTVQMYQGHTAPVTCVELVQPGYLISGSWDKTLKVWRTADKALVSSINAHGDFLKKLLVVPSLSLLISSSSDKTVKLWDIHDLEQPIGHLGSITAHTRPVEALAFQEQSDSSGVLYTSDSLGAVKAWDIQRPDKTSQDCHITLRDEWQPHRTGINAAFVANNLIFTGSTDESIIIQNIPRTPADLNPLHNVSQPSQVKALLPLFFIFADETYFVAGVGDSLRVYSYDPLSPGDPPELLREIEAHSHDITSLAIWMSISEDKQIELWILSASLDSTLRRWKLNDILKSNGDIVEKIPPQQPKETTSANDLTAEEERELAELMGDA